MKKLIGILTIGICISSCGDGDFSGVGPGDGFEIVDPGTSQGGSMARFTIAGNFLYIVHDYGLVPIDIRDLNNPIVRDEIKLDIGVETIFPYNNHLFVGSSSAVYIFDMVNPTRPQLLSTYVHAAACDPVVVSGNYAYVTLRSGRFCSQWQAVNILDVVDVSDLRNPRQVWTVPMQNPRGLGVGCNGKLFVCEGPGGIVQFDLTDPRMPIEERKYTAYHANDLIIRGSLMIVTGNDGVYQYDCSEDELRLLSLLPFAL